MASKILCKPEIKQTFLNFSTKERKAFIGRLLMNKNFINSLLVFYSFMAPSLRIFLPNRTSFKILFIEGIIFIFIDGLFLKINFINALKFI